MKLDNYYSEITRVREKMSPISICIYPTNRCSCKCIMCDVHKIQDKADLPFDKLLDVIIMAHLMKVESIVFIGGGEPTLYDHLPHIIEHINEFTQMSMGILTNGNTNFNFGCAAKNYRMKFIRFSIDAVSKELYKKIRGAVLDKVLNNFSTVLNVAPEKTRINALIMDENIFDVKNLIDFAADNHTTINFTLAVNCNSFKNKIKINELTRLQYYKSSCHNLNILFEKHELINKHECVLPLIYAVIDAKGDVFPCTIAAQSLGINIDNRDVILGNICQDTFSSIWLRSGTRRLNMSSNPDKFNICRWCNRGGISTCKLNMQYRNEYETLKSLHKATFL